MQLSPAYVAWDGYEEDVAEQLTAVAAGPAAGGSPRHCGTGSTRTG
ncbi:hypothetical protein [Geodermatophilus sp. SYSU D00766]